ncbi:Heat shock protein hsp98 [Trichoderma virens FT-333]|nr:Heat shock protein hsp98 [Trichoderma virens FT-333]
MTSRMDFTDRAQKAIEDAMSMAEQYGHSQLLPVHLAVSLLEPPVDQSKDQQNGPQQTTVTLFRQAVSLSPSFHAVLRKAQDLQKVQKDTFIAVDHLITALSEDVGIQACLKEGNIPKPKLLQEAVTAIRGTRRVDSKNADTEQENENLAKFTIDMTALARDKKIDPVIGREEEIRRVVRILSRRTKNNPVLIGEPGVGKTTVVEGLAQRIVNRDVPDNLKACKLLSLDVGALVAGSKFRGEFEERMKGVLKEVTESKEMIVLFVDEIHLLMGAGSSGEGGMDAANLLKPMLARGQLHCIGATTLAEYRKYVEKDAAFERRFQQVLVKEPTIPETISILRGLKSKYDSHHKVSILDSALVAAANLAARYLTSRRMPDSAIDLIDEAAAAVRVARESQPEIIDSLERKLRQFKIEIAALEKEHDEASQIRLQQAKKDAQNVEEELQPLREKYQNDIKRNDEIHQAKDKLEDLKKRLEDAINAGNHQRAADLKYGAILEQEALIKKLEEKKNAADVALNANGDTSVMVTDIVTADNINEIVARWTGIPVTRLRTSEKEKLIQMEKVLSKVVVGQKEAVQSVANAIRLQRSGLSNPNQPPSFLFCGPSGTGKTLLTKALAEFLFDDPKSMIRFDMSEYQERHALSRMIGAPPGYVGHDAGGQLTEALRRKPFSILLFDEVEKAAKEILTVLLQLMDDGRITDGQGRVIDCKNCIVVMTSNLGAEYLVRPGVKEGRVDANTRELVMSALRNYFLPEFLNRINSVVIFNRLTRKEIRKIVDLRITEIQKRLEDNGRKVHISVSDEAKDYLGNAGYSPAYGARPLARLIEKEVLNRLAILILRNSIRDGETAQVELDDNKIIVLSNHPDSGTDDDDEDMYDEDDVEDVIGEDMDEDIYD